jgi:hypothetical protein
MFPTTSSVKLGPFSCRVIASGGAKAFAVTVAVVQYQRLSDAQRQQRPLFQFNFQKFQSRTAL